MRQIASTSWSPPGILPYCGPTAPGAATFTSNWGGRRRRSISGSSPTSSPAVSRCRLCVERLSCTATADGPRSRRPSCEVVEVFRQRRRLCQFRKAPSGGGEHRRPTQSIRIPSTKTKTQETHPPVLPPHAIALGRVHSDPRNHPLRLLPSHRLHRPALSLRNDSTYVPRQSSGARRIPRSWHLADAELVQIRSRAGLQRSKAHIPNPPALSPTAQTPLPRRPQFADDSAPAVAS